MPAGVPLHAAALSTIPSRAQHLPGLDTLRFLCALLVMVAHYGLPPLPASFDETLPLKMVRGVYALSLNGQAAVMIFFVVSGLCIHLPQLHGPPAGWLAFLCRRYVRLVLPLAAAWSLGPLLGSKIFLGENPVRAVIWSLFAELTYYSLYPLLHALRRRWGWGRVLGGSFGLSAVLLAQHHGVKHPGALPWPALALVFLPVWLLGCRLAEVVAGHPAQTLPTGRRWVWRGAIAAAGLTSQVIIYHVPAFLPEARFNVSLVLFGVLAAAWLRRELPHFLAHPPPHWLEWCGGWSYSLYLTHFNWLDLWQRFGRDALGFADPLRWPEACLRLGFGLLLTLGFYYLIEAPAHTLARHWSRRLASRKSVA